MSDSPLTYTYTPGPEEGVTVLQLVGPLTLSNMFAFQAQFRSARPACLILDMAGVPYMDSAGLGLIVNYHVGAQADHRTFLLAGVLPRVLALFEMSKVDKILRFYPTVEEASAAARG